MSRNLRIMIAILALGGVVASCILLVWLPRAPLWLAEQRWQNREACANYEAFNHVFLFTFRRKKLW